MADKEDGRRGFLRRLFSRSGKTTGKRFRLTLVDIAAILISVGAIGLSSLGAVQAAGEPQAIISNGQDEWVYPLNTDRSIDVAGPLGTTIVHIHNNAVCIEDSPCPNKTCVAAGDISQPGQWIACLPNQVFVRIEGGSTREKPVDIGSW